MRNIIITGGAGFIGANLANYYLEHGDHVVLYDTLARTGCINNLVWLRSNAYAGNLECIVGDVRMPTTAFIRAVLDADAIFHMAAQVAVTTSVADPEADYETNVGGTFKLLELVRKSPNKQPIVFYASTNKVYGGMEHIAIERGRERYRYRDLPQGISEDQLLDFHSPYGCSKGAAEQYVRDYARIYNLRTVVFRQSCIYGYRQYGIEDQGWVAWFIIAAVLGQPITIYGDGMQVRDVLFIDDLVNAYDKAWMHIGATSGQVYNIGGSASNTISLLDLLNMLRTDVRATLMAEHADWRPGDQPVYVSNIAKAMHDFGWKPEIRWETGIHLLIEWVQENRQMLEGLFSRPADTVRC